MLKNLYTVALRNLIKNKTYSLINIVGLALGITSSLLVFLLITFLFSYDRYHENFDRIYRVVTQTTQRERTDHTPGVPIPFVDAFREEFAGLDEVLSISNYWGALVDIENGVADTHTFREESGIGVTSSLYFEMFDRKILHGATQGMLGKPNQVVISQSFAKKYFGAEDAVGKNLTLDKELLFTVSAVMEDYPPHTDFPFDVFFSYATFKEKWKDNGWGSVSSDDQCYLILEKGVKPQNIEAQLPDFVRKYFKDAEKDNRVLSLQPLADLHFSDRYSNYNYRTVSMGNIYAMGVVGLFLLITCSINFINLTTAVAVKRSKEIGIRKVLGSRKRMLVTQLLGETGIITLIALLLSLALTEAALIPLREFLDAEIPFSFAQNPWIVLFLLMLWFGVTLLSGFYPATIMAKYHPIEALKNRLTYKGASGGLTMRRVLVVFQFVVSQAFIIATLIVFKQMNFFEKQDLGFDKEAILSIGIPDAPLEKHQTYQKELGRMGNVAHVSLSSKPPSSGSVSVFNIEKPGEEDSYYPQVKTGDAYYGQVYGLNLLAGSFYPESDSLNGFVINEKMVKLLGYQQPTDAVGETLSKWGKLHPITGVVKDFHTMSLHREIDPTLILINPNNYREAAVRLQPKTNLKEFLQEAEKVYKLIYTGYPFEYEILDEEIAGFYESEQKMSTILKVASALAILIGLMGLYGLISFLSEIKTKEIGVRKVLGATVGQIAFLLLKDLVILLLIAFAIASPLVWLGMESWLENFAYRIQLKGDIFALGGGLAFIIALLVAGFKAWRTANINPAFSLRSE